MTDKPVLLALVVLIVWMMPIVIAFTRHHHQRYAIAALAVLLSWTFIGWPLAVVWSLSAVRRA